MADDTTKRSLPAITTGMEKLWSSVGNSYPTFSSTAGASPTSSKFSMGAGGSDADHLRDDKVVIVVV
jgi:hypothetical protein